MKKKLLYIDMDNVLVDFQSGIDQLDPGSKKKYRFRYDEVPGIFATMDPLPGAIESFIKLKKHFNVYILSTAPWENPSAWSDKISWVKKYLGKHAWKRLILTHNKHLNRGDYLVDDRKKNGAGKFEGELIQFGTKQFPDWPAVMDYLHGKK